MRIFALGRLILCGSPLLMGQRVDPSQARASYLAPSEIESVSGTVRPGPKEGSTRDLDDRAIFRGTRALEGSPRWLLAQQDNEISVSSASRTFGCALNTNFGGQALPRLQSLLTAATADSEHAARYLKGVNQRRRPFLRDDGPVCVPTEPLQGSFDYPSGHTTFGWTVGLILAELMPERSAQILLRARAYGESRVVCGVHNASAVEAGIVTATAIVAALHGSDGFRADMEAAKSELARLPVSSQAALQSCALEATTISKPPY